MTQLAACVFDFDGTLVDTEWSIYEMAAATFAEFDIKLEVPQWAAVVGLADGKWWHHLCESNGWDIDADAWWTHYNSIDRSFRDRLPLESGARELIEDLAAAGVPLGVASSSSVSWVENHLRRLGVLDRFTSLAGADRVGGAGKPNPDTYLLACRELGVDPADAVAVEDTHHGIAAAHAAGLACVVVPSHITRLTDLSSADMTVGSLADLDLEQLSALVRKRSEAGPRRDGP